MKNLMLVTVFFSCLSGVIYAQDPLFVAKIKKEEVPAAVVSSIQEDYGNEIIVTEYKALPIELVDEGWYIRTNPETQGKDYDTYVVSFSGENMKGQATYDANGKLISASEHITQAVLPRPVQKSIGMDYPGWSVATDHELITVSKNDQRKAFYKVKLTRGNEIEWATYNANGHLVKAGKEHKKPHLRLRSKEDKDQRENG